MLFGLCFIFFKGNQEIIIRHDITVGVPVTDITLKVTLFTQFDHPYIIFRSEVYCIIEITTKTVIVQIVSLFIIEVKLIFKGDLGR